MTCTCGVVLARPRQLRTLSNQSVGISSLRVTKHLLSCKPRSTKQTRTLFREGMMRQSHSTRMCWQRCLSWLRSPKACQKSTEKRATCTRVWRLRCSQPLKRKRTRISGTFVLRSPWRLKARRSRLGTTIIVRWRHSIRWRTFIEFWSWSWRSCKLSTYPRTCSLLSNVLSPNKSSFWRASKKRTPNTGKPWRR